MANFTGTVFIDNDSDGIYGAGDQPYPGLTVTVDDTADGGLVVTGQTDEFGFYDIDSTGADGPTPTVTVSILPLYTPSPFGLGNPQFPPGPGMTFFSFIGPMLNANGWPVPDPLGNDGTVINVD